MRQTTEREYQVWMEWRAEHEWNTPSKTDWYLMQINRDLRQLFAKGAQGTTLEDLRLPFGGPTAAAQPATAQAGRPESPRKQDYSRRTEGNDGTPRNLTPEQQRLREQALRNKAAWVEWGRTVPGATLINADGTTEAVGPAPEEYRKQMKRGKVPALPTARVGERVGPKPRPQRG